MPSSHDQRTRQLEPPEFVFQDASIAFPQFISAERRAIAEKSLDTLALLWAADAQIIDQRGTENTEDDYIWDSRRAILDRYTVVVFRFPPPLIDPPGDLRLRCAGGSVEENSNLCLVSPQEGTIVYANREGDEWQFGYRDGRWWILGLAYAR